MNSLKDHGGKISVAARETGIPRQRHYKWYNTDAVYRDQCDEIVGAPRCSRQKTGRPTKYSPPVVKKICSAIADGTPLSHAAAIGGISYQTLSEWRKQYPEFSDAIDAAQAEGIHARLKLILSAAEGGDVSAARWWLEHVVPEHFAKNRVDHQHSVEGKVTHSYTVAPEVLDAIAETRRRNDSH